MTHINLNDPDFDAPAGNHIAVDVTGSQNQTGTRRQAEAPYQELTSVRNEMTHSAMFIAGLVAGALTLSTIGFFILLFVMF